MPGRWSGLKVAVPAALVALAAGILFAAAARERIAPQSDLWDYAQEARQLARGEGFTSLYTYPVHLHPGDAPPFAVRWRLPLYAALGSVLLQAGVPLPDGYLWLGALAHALLVALTALLAMRLAAGAAPPPPPAPAGAAGGPGPSAGPAVSAAAAGWIAASAALLCPLLLDPYNPGMSQAPAAVLGLAVWLIALRPGGWGATACAALAAAAAWYLRGESLLMAPLWAWAIGRSSGARRALGFLLLYALLCAPWLIALRLSEGHAAPLQGNPMLLYTHEYPGYSSSRALDAVLPGPLAYVRAHAASFALRYAKDLAGYAVDFLGGLGPFAVALLVTATLLGAARPSTPAALALAIPLQVLAFSALERSPRFLTPVAPIACALVGVAASSLLARQRPRRLVPLLVVALLLERGATLALEGADARRREPPLPAALTGALAERSVRWPGRALVLTDVPDWAAWHLDRPALLLPLSRDLDRLTSSREVAGVLLSPRARARNEADGDSTWVETIDQAAPIAGYDGPERLPGGALWYARRAPHQPR